MKVQTNAGEVELTANMVRPGMMFRWSDGSVAATQRIAGIVAAVWEGDPEAHAVELLGCDPAIAAREDVERYGVAPGIDAGAHGFARLRGGGAVDVRRPDGVVAGTVWESAGHRLTVLGSDVRIRRPDGSTFTEHLGVESPDAFEWRFVGLDARHAAPEDVVRLCCAASKWPESGTGYVRHCTLAIGDHDTHEDIAAGVRWAAKATLHAPPSVDALPRVVTWTPRAGVTWYYGAQPVSSPDEAARLCGKGSAMDGVVKDAHAVPAQLPGMMPEPPGGWRSPEQIDREVSERGRRNREAPLVALVAAVPEGLDPIGWRAAVLGLRERHVLNGQGEHADTATVLDAANLTVMLQRFALDVARGAPVKEAQQSATNSRCLAMTTAYARAIAKPGPRPTPERKIGGRAVRLTVDDGRDD